MYPNCSKMTYTHCILTWSPTIPSRWWSVSCWTSTRHPGSCTLCFWRICSSSIDSFIEMLYVILCFQCSHFISNWRNVQYVSYVVMNSTVLIFIWRTKNQRLCNYGKSFRCLYSSLIPILYLHIKKVFSITKSQNVFMTLGLCPS
jgi:hypothetical protein